jgi:hypothetical protein
MEEIMNKAVIVSQISSCISAMPRRGENPTDTLFQIRDILKDLFLHLKDTLNVETDFSMACNTFFGQK